MESAVAAAQEALAPVFQCDEQLLYSVGFRPDSDSHPELYDVDSDEEDKVRFGISTDAYPASEYSDSERQ